MNKFLYIAIDLGCILVPLLFSFHPKIKFYKLWWAFWFPCIITTIVFVGWDILFTRLGVWTFNPQYLVGVYLYNLPIEEVLFFICIPYACVFTYYCFTLFWGQNRFINQGQIIATSLVILLVIISITNYNKLYTSVTFILLALFLLFLLISRVNYLGMFFATFVVLLLPFFVSNGILTGSFIENPVVKYNNEENLSIRMLTIPVEDVFYGMLLVLSNVFGFELLKTKQVKS